ncbi:zinc finger CCCH domain-containing protein 18-like [Varroa jacobsoni]|uniref:C3H1-type domain-containing protein n=1 Tax=Varroa destructor TaxID=109461 RepID=A0A7M7KG67_VARDE|nr:zinc finger CCCH domain-containing protein 18-like [Varroa destructor]XP_022704216.1 zinc finger CCCH domain-containing protein 18-like [Varroa jacobsoni]
MSSPDSNAPTADSNSNLDSAADEKTKDSIISQESHNSQNSSKISDNPMEPHDGVLDFEEDGPEPGDNKYDDANSRSPSVSPFRSGCGSPAGGKPPACDDGNDEVSKDGADEIELPEEGEEKEDQQDEDEDEDDKVVEKEKQKKKRSESDLEDGEVTDSEDEEGERFSSPSKADKDKPAVCRFFSRGQCTWGNQCRFIHPGMQPGGPGGPMSGPPGPPYGGPPPHPPHGPPPRLFGGPGGPFPPGPHFPPPPMAPVESAWERGLRNAKEMLKEANRRREEDPAFEDRKLHQGLQASPVRDLSPPRVSPSPSPPLRSKMYGTYERHREVPRSLSPVNVDRLRQERYAAAERERARAGPGDVWRDPWMRSKSPIRGRPRRRSRSWSSRSSSSSSGSSYSSSRSSSYSRSRSRDRRRNYGGRSGPPMGRGPRGGGGGGGGGGRQRYPSERGGRLVASPSPTRYRRGGINTAGTGGGRGRRRSSSSSSSSSRSPSPRRRRYSRSKTPEGIPRRPRQVSPLGRPIGTQIKMNLLDKSKKLPVKRPFSASPSRSPSRSPKKLRVSPSPPPKAVEKENKDKKKEKDKKSDAAKRDELMRQLKAVEDAIAKKKAKT